MNCTSTKHPIARNGTYTVPRRRAYRLPQPGKYCSEHFLHWGSVGFKRRCSIIAVPCMDKRQRWASWRKYVVVTCSYPVYVVDS